MSITLYVGSEQIVLLRERVVVQYKPLYPDGFDHTPTIDPEYGELPPDNPWELNVTDENFQMLFQLLNIPYTATQYGVESGVVEKLDDLILACDGALSTVHSIPEIDGGTLTETHVQPGAATVIHCGRSDGYLQNRISKLRELAVIAKERDAVLFYV